MEEGPCSQGQVLAGYIAAPGDAAFVMTCIVLPQVQVGSWQTTCTARFALLLLYVRLENGPGAVEPTASALLTIKSPRCAFLITILPPA